MARSKNKRTRSPVRGRGGSSREAKKTRETTETQSSSGRQPFTITTSGGDQLAVAAKIALVFGLTGEESKATLDLAKNLQPDDPALLITFKPGPQVRAALQIGGAAVAVDRPCPPGANGGVALQNIKDWVTSLVDGDETPATVTEVGESGLALGNLDQNQYAQIVMSLSFNPDPHPNAWAAGVLGAGQSIGAVVSVVGSGVGSATVGPVPSIVFFG